jgi:DNA-binding CsgD family transcriptional regulator
VPSIFVLGRQTLAREGLAAFLTSKGYSVECGEKLSGGAHDFLICVDLPRPDESWIAVSTGSESLGAISLSEGPERLLSRLKLRRLREAHATQIPLSSREAEIVRLLGKGLTNRQIAAMLELKEQSVKNLIYRTMKKEFCANRTQLALRAKLAE